MIGTHIHETHRKPYSSIENCRKLKKCLQISMVIADLTLFSNESSNYCYFSNPTWVPIEVPVKL